MTDREDMLEHSRRMTPSRTCLSRIAGAYFDSEGYVDSTFNVRFLNLSEREKEEQLSVAKTIPFSRTNDQLVEVPFDKAGMSRESLWQLLYGLRACGLENDSLMDLLYEQTGPYYCSEGDFYLAVYYGSYDVQLKTKDKVRLGESEAVYSFLIAAMGPVSAGYHMERPDYGFLYPAFTGGSAILSSFYVYDRDPARRRDALTALLAGR